MTQPLEAWRERLRQGGLRLGQWAGAIRNDLFGVRQRTLAPSAAALGHNTYLRQHDFIKMLLLAGLLHAAVLGAASLWPEEKVTDIPVRALTFKIGAGERIRPLQVSDAAAEPTAPALRMSPATPEEWRAEASVASPPTPVPAVKVPKVIPVVAPAQRHQPTENRQVSARQNNAADAANTAPGGQAAVAANPQRFVREGQNQPAADSAADSAAAEAAQAARARYEQELSGWIQRHKLYPADAGGREGRVVMRMRIDRMGYVRYYAIEESAGVAALDAAAIDMIRRANPMPAVPPTYPAGNLIEFLIPIVFRVPA